ncbi:efflux RND transporter permease subunit [Hirschia baltica]|uniref:Acriflavin resistance protein n=1 Tax=Hirschia baltica (strain ATCC 49814 / DSM 5838 / IFAM 1418) TaxID=582402 RepID=C6XM94_HIRBI|nr:efflux RND transporter permease subunit [Hirschia baltica]ACT58037.1 acriflavin resistance protein [Hirschia baltica ATCC 49814]
MGDIISFWARNSVAANLLMICCIVGGLFGFSRLEQEVFPGGEFAGVSVTIAWPGASPQDAEEQLVLRLEEAVSDVDGIDRITSIAYEDGGTVNIAALNSVDTQKFLDEIKLRVDSINNLPPSAYRPQVQQWKQNNEYFGLVVAGDIGTRELKHITDEIRDEIARIPGGELARVQGTLSEEVTIEVSESAMRQYGLTFSDIASAVQSSSINGSGGQVRTDTGNVSIQTRNLADTADQFNNLIVKQTANGGVIRVGDVARVIDGFVDADLQTSFEGKKAAFIMMRQTEKMNLPQYSKALKQYMEEKNETLPESITLNLLWSDHDFMSKLISIITNSAITGTILVLIVLLLFLRPIVAFWVAAGIMTAFAGGFFLLPMMGVSLNILSLFACLLVIGVVVDDAIVIGESIHTEVESGRREGVEAAIHGAKAVAKPVLFGVITTMIAFAPWAMISGGARQFTQNFTLTVIAALTFSLVEAFLILPAHLAHLKKQKTEGGESLKSRIGAKFTRFQRIIADSLLWVARTIYMPILKFAIKMRYATAAAFIALFMFALGLVQHGYVPFKFDPETEGDFIFVQIEMPDGTPFSRVDQVRAQLNAGIQALKDSQNEKWSELDFDIVRDASIVASEGEVMSWIGLAAPEIRPRTVSTKALAEELRDLTGDIPDAEDAQFAFSFNDNDPRLRFALNHPDLDVLRKAADELRTHLGTYAQAYNVGDNFSAAAQEIRLTMKPGAESLGLTLRDVSSQVRQAYYGIEAQRLPRDGDDVRVMVKLPQEARRSLDSLDQFRIRTADGREIPLMEVAEIEFAPGINRILRRERQRSVSVFAEVAGEAQREIIQAVNKDFMPSLQEKYPGLTSGALGSAEREAEFFQEIIGLQLGAFFMMYCLLAIAFKSYSQPLLIMSAIPFGFAGAVFGHALLGVPMAMFSIFGIAAAAGVVINDNLVLIDYLNKRREHGVGAFQAIVESGVSRFRPILLTSITTFIGILPMIMDRSMQAQFLKPMVVSLGCAVIFALFLSLLLVPSLYAIGVEIGRISARIFKGKKYQPIGHTFDEETLDISGDADAEGLAVPAE